MAWNDLPAGLKIDYFTFPSPKTQSFYLLRDLGRGSNGRAFLVCNSKGETLVAKFFLAKDDVAHQTRESAIIRQQQRALLLDQRKSEAEEEMEYWNSVYNGNYDVQVRKLHGHWCLMLPYFHPLLDVKSRERRLPQVREVLEHFKSKKLKYNEDDLRWRHVGIRQNDICLLDLGSLEPCKEGEIIDVEAQMNILKAKIGSR
jgi:hypothetical protein